MAAPDHLCILEIDTTGPIENVSVRYVFCQNLSYSDLILCTEISFESFCSSDVSRSSLVFLKGEILTPKVV